MTLSVTAVLSEVDKYTDKCTHVISISEDVEQVPQFNFDWMRQFKDDPPVVKTDLERVLRQSQEAALAYYEFLGEVGLNEA